MTLDTSFEVLRTLPTAGIALVKHNQTEETEWVEWDHENNRKVLEEKAENDSKIRMLHHKAPERHGPLPPSLEFTKKDLMTEFVLNPPQDGTKAQNLVIFLHGRGDSCQSLGHFGQQMQLPQTATLSLQAPGQLPFKMGPTWLRDLDDQSFEIIPPQIFHSDRAKSLDEACSFLSSVIDKLVHSYRWRYDRIFLFGFSQGACVAYQYATQYSCRLGGIILVAGGVLGKNSVQKHQKKKKETPSLMIYGTLDDVYPMMLAHKTYESFQALHGNGITFFQTFDKPHRMISGRQEMYQVMKFFANHLYLKNLALENQPDIIEIQPF